MGKSSRKKRRSDASPLAPRKKKTKSMKKVRNKSKKLRCRHDSDSDSYSSDYDSSGSSSYSSSEDDYKRRRRSRSLTRGKARGSKKRNRRRSYSSESSEDSRPARKRRRSERKGGSGVRKKSSKKKHKRRAASVSSTSSGSFSYSTRDDDDESERSGESEFESRRGRSMRRDKYKRDAGKEKVGAERSRYRRESSSSFSESSMSSRDQDEEEMITATSSMRLKSVIVIANEAEERKWDGDEHKEEILYDNDDYPSSHSNDSNDGGCKRELAHQSYVESKIKGPEELAESAAPNTGSASLVEKTGNISGGALDEESKLRQMALERFKRFRGLTKVTGASDQRGNNDDVKQAPAVTSKSNQNMAPQEISTRSANTTQDEGNRARAEGRTSTRTRPFVGRICDQEHEAAGPSSGGSVQVSGGGFPGRSPNRGSSSAANKPRVTAFTWRRDPAKTDAAAKASPRLLKEPPQAKLLEAEVSANKDAANLAKTGTAGNKSGGGDSEVNKEGDSAVHEPSSSSRPESVSGVSKSDDKVKDEGKDGPRYEQKTMTVTRGGESIQVSYQVYIPKRAPALARRQLNR